VVPTGTPGPTAQQARGTSVWTTSSPAQLAPFYCLHGLLGRSALFSSLVVPQRGMGTVK
jgi:hypothetical protein